MFTSLINRCHHLTFMALKISCYKNSKSAVNLLFGQPSIRSGTIRLIQYGAQMASNNSENDKIKEFDTLGKNVRELIEAAVLARKKAYCPHSNFAVGAAVRTITGEIFTGCNVENATYSPSMCAERVAYSKAISEGFREFTEVAVVAHQEDGFTAPCGVCRQVMAEFARIDVPVYLSKPSPFRVYVTSLFELLPIRFFSPDKINNKDFTKV